MRLFDGVCDLARGAAAAGVWRKGYVKLFRLFCTGLYSQAERGIVFEDGLTLFLCRTSRFLPRLTTEFRLR